MDDKAMAPHKKCPHCEGELTEFTHDDLGGDSVFACGTTYHYELAGGAILGRHEQSPECLALAAQGDREPPCAIQWL